MPYTSEHLSEYFERYRHWAVLTGAGVSAASGIPTYRDATGGWLRNRPIQHQEFVHHVSSRQRYWGRSLIGWPGIREARPNSLHLALTRFEAAEYSTLLITQNVDRLHQRAGSKAVVDLHGRLDKVRCLNCNAGYEREYVQSHLVRLNPQHHQFATVARPDGDADLADQDVASVRILDCEACGGTLMPDVVFFGGNVPRERVQQCQAAVASAEGLLVVGSSLQVYSGFRFCKQAIALGKPLIVVNEGKTRADDLATLKIETGALQHLITAIDLLPNRPKTNVSPNSALINQNDLKGI